MKVRKEIITQEDITQALSKFREQGRLIRILPDEPNPPRLLVGTRHGLYEPVSELAQMSLD